MAMFEFLKKKTAPEELGAGLLGLTAPRTPGIGDQEITTLGVTTPDEANAVRFELFVLRAFAAEHIANQLLTKDAAARAREALWLFLEETTPWGWGEFERFRHAVSDYADVEFMFGGLRDDVKEIAWEVGKVFAKRCGRVLDPLAVSVGLTHYLITYKIGRDFIKSVRVVDSEKARQALAHRKDLRRKRKGG